MNLEEIDKKLRKQYWQTIFVILSHVLIYGLVFGFLAWVIFLVLLILNTL